MINLLETYSPVQAAGILARAALSLEDEHNPAAEYFVDDEQSIRSNILMGMRQRLGISSSDDSDLANARIVGELDSESEHLLGPVDEEAALRRLSDEGELPSDMYEVIVDKNIYNQNHLKFVEETNNIVKSVKQCDLQEHFAYRLLKSHDGMMSLFAKRFKNKFPGKSFTMLVIAERRGLFIFVQQAWRVYDEVASLQKGNTLIDFLGKFANYYGKDFHLGNFYGKFFSVTDYPDCNQIEINLPHPQDRSKEQNVFIGVTTGKTTEGKMAITALAIDLNKYFRFIESRK